MFRYIFEEVDFDTFKLRYKALHQTGLENVGPLTISNNPECSILVLSTKWLVSGSLPPPPLPHILFLLLRLLFPPYSMLEISNAISWLSHIRIPSQTHERKEAQSVLFVWGPLSAVIFDPVSFEMGVEGKFRPQGDYRWMLSGNSL